MLSIRQLGKIVDALREYYDVSNTEEVTLEANPEDLSLHIENEGLTTETDAARKAIIFTGG